MKRALQFDNLFVENNPNEWFVLRTFPQGYEILDFGRLILAGMLDSMTVIKPQIRRNCRLNLDWTAITYI
jgi:hypothetical protein